MADSIQNFTFYHFKPVENLNQVPGFGLNSTLSFGRLRTYDSNGFGPVARGPAAAGPPAAQISHWHCLNTSGTSASAVLGKEVLAQRVTAVWGSSIWGPGVQALSSSVNDASVNDAGTRRCWNLKSIASIESPSSRIAKHYDSVSDFQFH